MPPDEVSTTGRKPALAANPVATVGYVESYREMWDSDDAGEALA